MNAPIVLDSLGRAFDEHGTVLPIKPKIWSTLKINRKAEEIAKKKLEAVRK